MSEQPEQLALTPCEGVFNHPKVDGRVLLPNATFTARNRISGKSSKYLYLGLMGETASGELYVDCVDRRGHTHTIAVSTITYVRRSPIQGKKA